MAAIEDILGLGKLSQYDYFSRPLSDIFSPVPDLTPYTNIAPSVPIDERNPSAVEAAKQSANLDLSSADRVDDEQFNDILWKMIKANQARPPVRNQSPIQLLQSAGY